MKISKNIIQKNKTKVNKKSRRQQCKYTQETSYIVILFSLIITPHTNNFYSIYIFKHFIKLDISATWECKLVKNMNISLLYVDQNNESTADKSHYSAQVAYTF
ncbi:MAG: hypothetical protein IE909_02955 [Campylobacterales bacterium]|nr:hypothetical protein [Campylobacterales bacterium]